MLPRLPVWGESSEAPASPEVSEETKQSIHQNSELRETHQSLTGCDVTPPVTVIRQKMGTRGERDNSYDTDDLIRLQRETNRTSSCHVMSSLIRRLFVFQFRSERSEDATRSWISETPPGLQDATGDKVFSKNAFKCLSGANMKLGSLSQSN